MVLTFSDVLGVSESVLKKITLPFGGGLGRLRLTCGAVSGAAAVIGLLLSADEVDAENKKRVYGAVQEFCARFTAENGSVICAELLSKAGQSVEVGGTAEARTKEYYKKRSCAESVASATAILEE